MGRQTCKPRTILHNVGTEVNLKTSMEVRAEGGRARVICTKNQKGDEQSGALGRALKDNTTSRHGQEEEGSRTGEIHKSRLGIEHREHQ